MNLLPPKPTEKWIKTALLVTGGYMFTAYTLAALMVFSPYPFASIVLLVIGHNQGQIYQKWRDYAREKRWFCD